MKLDVESLNENELNEILDAILQKKDRLRFEREEKAWNDVVKAIRAYTSTFGDIKVQTYGEIIFLDNATNMEEFGVISQM